MICVLKSEFMQLIVQGVFSESRAADLCLDVSCQNLLFLILVAIFTVP